MTVTYCSDFHDLAKFFKATSADHRPELLVFRGFLSIVTARTMKLKFDGLLSQGASSIYGSSATPLYEYREDTHRPLKQYLEEANARWLQHLEMLNKFGNPLQEIMNDLSVAAEAPVLRLELLGEPCFFGQYRCFERKEILPHNDVIEHEFPSLIGRPPQQWALNLALCSPDVGGELSIWDLRPSDEHYVAYGYTKPTAEPVVHFHPLTGDLYFFQSGYVHAISQPAGARCSLSGFIAGP